MTLEDLKRAAYNWTEPAEMTPEQRALWHGLGYCYEWYRAHPEDKKECDMLAQIYIKLFWKGKT